MDLSLKRSVLHSQSNYSDQPGSERQHILQFPRGGLVPEKLPLQTDSEKDKPSYDLPSRMYNSGRARCRLVSIPEQPTRDRMDGYPAFQISRRDMLAAAPVTTALPAVASA